MIIVIKKDLFCMVTFPKLLAEIFLKINFGKFARIRPFVSLRV